MPEDCIFEEGRKQALITGLGRAVERIKRRIVSDERFLFARALCSWPRGVGSAWPSSRYLADCMASEALTAPEGLIVELGAGTGVVTQALLDGGLDPARLVVVERSALLAAHLRRRFPELAVLEGDAMCLGALLGARAREVTAVVSSLPLKSLPSGIVERIGEELDRLLPTGAPFIQFTYSLRADAVGWEHTTRCVRSRTVWRNVPPARVNSFAWGY